MKSVLISIQPKWVEKIASGQKTVEVRKTKPNLATPFKCYIYATWNGSKKEILVKANGKLFEEDFRKASGLRVSGKVIGEFVCDRIGEYDYDNYYAEYCVKGYIGAYMPTKEMCLTQSELRAYGKGENLYGWHISNLKIYDKPKELSEFRTVDLQGVRKCKSRKQSYFDGYCNNGGYLKHGFYCEEKEDWCDKCKTKPTTRPPQSWCYVEVQNERD